MAEIQQKYLETAMSILAAPGNSGNACCLEIFNVLYSCAKHAMLETFCPWVTDVITYELFVEEASTANPRSLGLKLERVPLSDDIKQIPLGELVITRGACVLPVRNAVSTDFRLLSLLAHNLEQQYPEHYRALISHNPEIAGLYTQISLLCSNSPPLREKIKQFCGILLRNGSRVTQLEATLTFASQRDVSVALEGLKAYFGLYPDRGSDVWQRFDKAFFEAVYNPAGCVEIAASKLREMLGEAMYKDLMEWSPALTPEQRQALQQKIALIYLLADVAPAELLMLEALPLEQLQGSGSQELVTKLRAAIEFVKKDQEYKAIEFTRKDTYTLVCFLRQCGSGELATKLMSDCRNVCSLQKAENMTQPLPSRLLLSALQQIAFPDILSIADFFRDFTDADIYAALLRSRSDVLARIISRNGFLDFQTVWVQLDKNQQRIFLEVLRAVLNIESWHIGVIFAGVEPGDYSMVRSVFEENLLSCFKDLKSLRDFLESLSSQKFQEICEYLRYEFIAMLGNTSIALELTKLDASSLRPIRSALTKPFNEILANPTTMNSFLRQYNPSELETIVAALLPSSRDDSKTPEYMLKLLKGFPPGYATPRIIGIFLKIFRCETLGSNYAILQEYLPYMLVDPEGIIEFLEEFSVLQLDLVCRALTGHLRDNILKDPEKRWLMMTCLQKTTLSLAQIICQFLQNDLAQMPDLMHDFLLKEAQSTFESRCKILEAPLAVMFASPEIRSAFLRTFESAQVEQILLVLIPNFSLIFAEPGDLQIFLNERAEELTPLVLASFLHSYSSQDLLNICRVLGDSIFKKNGHGYTIKFLIVARSNSNLTAEVVAVCLQIFPADVLDEMCRELQDVLNQVFPKKDPQALANFLKIFADDQLEKICKARESDLYACLLSVREIASFLGNFRLLICPTLFNLIMNVCQSVESFESVSSSGLNIAIDQRIDKFFEVYRLLREQQKVLFKKDDPWVQERDKFSRKTLRDSQKFALFRSIKRYADQKLHSRTHEAWKLATEFCNGQVSGQELESQIANWASNHSSYMFRTSQNPQALFQSPQQAGATPAAALHVAPRLTNSNGADSSS